MDDLRDLAVAVPAVAGDDEEVVEGPPPPPPLGAMVDEEVVAVAAANENPEANGGGADPGARPDPDGQEIHDDDTTSTIMLSAKNFREAVTILEDANDRRPINHFSLFSYKSDEGNDPDSFHRFVRSLGRREGGRSIQQFNLYLDWTALPEDDMDDLFGTVLPTHHTIEIIHIDINSLPARFLRMLMESIPAAGETLLSRMRIDCFGEINAATQTLAARAIARLLERNAAISFLDVNVKLYADECRFICQALIRNTTLRRLELSVKKIFSNTLDGVAASSLRRLGVKGSFSKVAVSSLARQLRTNETLLYLSLNSTDDGYRNPQALLELMKTYNHTLHSVDGNLGSEHDDVEVREQFEECMWRNFWIRIRLITEPTTFDSEEVSQELPVLKRISDHPTLMYRALKKSYACEVSNLLALKAKAEATKTCIESDKPRRDRSSSYSERRRILGGKEETGNSTAM